MMNMTYLRFQTTHILALSNMVEDDGSPQRTVNEHVEETEPPNNLVMKMKSTGLTLS